MARRQSLEVPDTGTRLLGIDIGKKKWGLSISDTSKRIAFPFGIFPVDGTLDSTIADIVVSKNIEGLVIGIPQHRSGKLSSHAIHIQQEGQRLAEMLELPVYWQDERLTTATAQNHMEAFHKYPSKADDDIAAQVLLQRFLDSRQEA